MKTHLSVLKNMKITSNEERTFKFAALDFTDHKPFFYVLKNIPYYKIDNEVLIVERE